jgi:hypothetical protein
MLHSHTHPEYTVDRCSAGCTPSQFCLKPQPIGRPHTEAVQQVACCIRVFLAATGRFLVVVAV